MHFAERFKAEMKLPRFGGHPERDYSPRKSTNAAIVKERK